MMRIYFAAMIAALVVGAYWAGARVGRTKCMLTAATNNANAQLYTIKTQERVNAEVLNTNTRDIRRILRTEYTIAD